MPFRITPGVQFRHALFDMSNAFTRFARAQSQISTGQRVQVFSDDPSAAARALDLRTTISRTGQSRESIEQARSAADTQSGVLEEISALLIDARGLGQGAASGANSASDLEAFASDLESILDQVVARANQRFEGRYLFAGSKIASVPFPASRSFGSITSVSYQGDDITRRVRLGPADVKNVDLSGQDVFLSVQRSDTVLSGNAGLQAVLNANDTMVGSAKIVVAHTATVYGDGAGPGGGDTASGLAPGASSAADTVVGAAGVHKLTVSVDAFGISSIALDGGTPVPFAGTETDLPISNGSEQVHVDVTGLTPGFTGIVPLTGNGTIQVEGGPVQALTFTDDFVLADAEGRVVHLDTTDVTRADETLAVFPGTETVFDILIGLRDEVRGKAGFDSAGFVNRVQARLVALDRSHEGILRATSELGARSVSFDRIATSLEDFELALEERRGELELTDVFQASLELAQAENAYQAALAAAAKLNGPTLLNYL